MTLLIWTVYDHPLDYPDSFIARLSVVDAAGVYATNKILSADSLLALRNKIPGGLYCLPRAPVDDPCIVECWI